jgi:hypothetical protein
MAVVVAAFLFIPLMMSVTFLKVTAEKLRNSSDYTERIVLGIILLLSMGIPVAFAVGPVIYNWQHHPGSSVAYAVTMLTLFAWPRR